MANQDNTAIAVVAMNCRFPGGVNNPEEFWQMLLDQRDAWSEVPKERFNAKSFYHDSTDAGASMKYKGAYFLKDDIAKFDPSFFSITESEAIAIDPQHRLQLECAYEAFESASMTLSEIRGSRTAVFTSSFSRDYEIMQHRDPDNMLHFHATGCQVVASARLAYHFDLKGPSMNVDTACSGSAVSLHLACQALKNGEADQALVSGCNLMLDPTVTNGLNKLSFFSPEGRSYAFDSRASGYARGEGVACVILKPLAAALADGNTIRAVIRATATNQNGKTSTITIPNIGSQIDAGTVAYRNCKLDPSETFYVECHGTGTQAGDPMEIEAIGRLFGASKRYNTKTVVGSVKTNVGHLESASGLASLIKSILVLEKGIIPAHLNYENPNPRIAVDTWNVKIPVVAESWHPTMPRRISINNLGVGGSNVHIILEDLKSFINSTSYNISRTIQPKPHSTLSIATSSSQSLIFTLSAMTEKSLRKRIQALRKYCQNSDGSNSTFQSLAYTLSKRVEAFSWQWITIASSMAELLDQMKHENLNLQRVPTKIKAGLVFAGQGAQWHAMGRELLDLYPVFHDSMVEAGKLYRNLGASWSLLEELHRDKKDSRVDDAAIGQPLSTALQVSLVVLLKSWSVRPYCVIGHSSGEIAAAFTTGAISFEHALTIAYFRGLYTSRMRNIENAPDGAMMAAGISAEQAEEEIQQLSAPYSNNLGVACINSPVSVTISGDRKAVLALKSELDKREIFARLLKVDVAYHSGDMKLIAGDYLRSIAHCIPTKPSSTVEFWSSVRASRLQVEFLQPSYWIENLVSPVKFSQGLAAMVNQTESLGILIETSPHSVLEGPIKQILAPQKMVLPYTSMLKRGQDARTTVLHATQKMVYSGFCADMTQITSPLIRQDYARLLSDLPAYSWDHSSRYWYQSAISNRHLNRAFPYHELLGNRVPQSTTVAPQWRNVIKLSALDWLSDHRINQSIIFPGAGYLCMVMQAFYQNYSEKSFSPALPGFMEIRDISFDRGLLLDDSNSPEIVCYLRAEYENVRETADSSYEFRVVSSIDGGSSWQRHCRGTIGALKHKPAVASQQILSPDAETRQLDRKEVYQKFEQIGLNYGPWFRTITEGSIQESHFQGHVQPGIGENSTPYIIHPTTLDGLFQSMFIANVANRDCSTAMVPTSIDKIVISCDTTTSGSDPLFVEAHSKFIGKTALNASATITTSGGGDELALRIEGLAAVVLESELLTETPEDHGCYRLKWIADPTLMDEKSTKELCLRSTAGQEPCPTNPLYMRASLCFFDDALTQVPNIDDVQAEHLKHFWRYMQNALETHGGRPREPFQLSDLNVPSAECKMLEKIGPTLPEILKGNVDPLSLMLEDGLLYQYYAGDWIDYYYVQMGAYLRQLAFKNPAMKILEIGAGTGGTTLAVLPHMPMRHGFSYDFTDISSGFFVRAKEALKDYANSINYKKLNCEQDPVPQGFEEATYDLIMASNVLHATKDIQVTLTNVKKLLKPGGKLLLLEVTHPTAYLHLVFGCLSGWWLGSEDERTEGPCLTSSQWLKHLKGLGFSSSISLPEVGSQVDSTMSVIVATLDKPVSPPKTTFTIIVDDVNLVSPQNLQHALKKQLDVECDVQTWYDTIKPNQNLIFVGRETAHLLVGGDEMRFKAFQRLITTAAGTYFITTGATGEQGLPVAAAVTGLIRAIRSESDSLDHVTIDIESPSDIGHISTILSQCFCDQSNETDFAIRNGQIVVSRVIPDPIVSEFLINGDVEESQPLSTYEMAVKLDFATPGYLESLRFIPDDKISGALASDQIEIRVKAAGVNFRHVLYALGKFSAAEYAQRPAGECSGVVVAVGDDVKDQFRVGDRIVTSGIFNAFTTVVRCLAVSSRKIPDSMSYHEAASFPLTYLTAWFSLVNLAHIQKGDRVLIHSGTGAVGQIAIKIAHHFGATVFVTCGNEDKKRFLELELGIPPENIYSSKDTRFVDAIMKQTNGRGVDIILNALSGVFIPESGRCLATFGRFIEIGKNDILGKSKLDMGFFNNSTSFIALDLSRVYELHPEMIGELLQKMIDMLVNGSLTYPKPLHIREFAHSSDAFRYMSSGKHIGKMVLDLEASSNHKVTIPNFGAGAIRGNGTYVISGGLGGIGREICRWIAGQGDGINIVVLSRSRSFHDHKTAQDLSQEVKKLGASLHLISCDVSKEEEVIEAVEFCKQNLAPVAGVVQGAMVLRDCPFETMSPEQYKSVIMPKINGTQYLAKHLPPSKLDFFIILSSVGGVIGGPSQSNYSSAGAFMDSYARYLTSIGEPMTCLDLGWIQGAGYVEENKFASDHVASLGMQPIPVEKMLRAFSYVIKRKPQSSDQAQLVLGLSLTIKDHLTRGATFSFLDARRSEISEEPTNGLTQSKSVQQILQSCRSKAKAEAFIGQKLLDKMAALMAVPVSTLRLSGSIVDYGIDSLVAIELRNWIRQELGSKLGIFEILGSSCIKALAEVVTQRSRWLGDMDSPDNSDAKSETKFEQSQSDSGIGTDASSPHPKQSSVTSSPTSTQKSPLAQVHPSEDLPRLPVPSLRATTTSLLKTLKIVVRETHYEQSEKCVEKFLSSQGPILQQRLVDHARTIQNWHSDLWIDEQYWALRTPIAPFTNYFGVHEPSQATSALEAALLICSAVLDFQAQVEDGKMARDYLRDAAADMSQYKNMFHACRVPQKPKDTIVRFDANLSRHIVVIRKGHFFKLCYENLGQRLDKGQLTAGIDWILQQDLGPSIGIGALTTLDRDLWADGMSSIIGFSDEARQSVEDIKSSCFVLCLDASRPESLEELAEQIWYGNGINRWFDKGVQFVVTDNGRTGAVSEHSAADGGPGIRLHEFIQAYVRRTAGEPLENTSGIDGSKFATNLDFTVSQDIEQLVLKARSDFQATIDAETIVATSVDAFGEDALMKQKRNPNTCAQFIMNLAAYRMYGELKPNYEPVSLATFADGRWTSCSLITEELARFCRMASDPSCSQADRLAAFNDASKAHSKNITTTAEGFENTEAHLLALREMVREGEDVPVLLSDAAHLRSQHWFLSASSLPTVHHIHYGYWQVVEEGYGVGHQIRPNKMEFVITSSNGGCADYAKHIHDAAMDVGEMLGIC